MTRASVAVHDEPVAISAPLVTRRMFAQLTPMRARAGDTIRTETPIERDGAHSHSIVPGGFDVMS